MEKKEKEKIMQWLGKLIGSNLTRAYRWQYMPAYVFTDESGTEIALHAYSRCTIRKGNDLILDSSDICEPAEGVEQDPEDDYGWGDCVFDVDYFDKVKKVLPLRVESAEVKDDGTIRMRLQNDFHFACVPWRDNPYECWRIFVPGEDDQGIVYNGDGTVDDYADMAETTAEQNDKQTTTAEQEGQP